MAQEVSRFFDSVAHDKQYPADEFAEYFRIFLTDGVSALGTNLQVTAPGTGLVVDVDFGAAMVYGYGYWLKDDGTGKLQLTCSPPEQQPRIDRIVLRLDKGTSSRETRAVILKGTPAAAPTPPALTRAGNIYEISLCRIQVNTGALVITPDLLIDERADYDVCGLIEPRLLRDKVDQDVRAGSSPTFNTVNAAKVIGAVYQ